MDLDKNKIKAPYNVPKGYFEGMEERLLSEMKISDLSAMRLPKVPNSYFEGLENQVLSLSQLDIFDDVQSLPTPKNYFEEMEDQILSQVHLDGFSHPIVETGYFEDLENSVLAKTKLEAFDKIEKLPVPEGYFGKLEEDLISKTSNKPTFKLIRSFKVFRTAAAVAIFALLGYGLSTINTEPKDELAAISTNALVAYLVEQPLMEEDLQFLITENDRILPIEVTDNDISNYLKENGI